MVSFRRTVRITAVVLASLLPAADATFAQAMPARCRSRSCSRARSPGSCSRTTSYLGTPSKPVTMNATMGNLTVAPSVTYLRGTGCTDTAVAAE